MKRLQKIARDDGTWNALRKKWKLQYEGNDEQQSAYEKLLSETLQPIVQDESGRAYVYAVDDDRYSFVCFVNHTELPGHVGEVLRVRHVTMCPRLDSEDYELREYIEKLSELITGLITLSEKELLTGCIKLHLRSPADYVYLKTFGNKLDQDKRFNVSSHGAWLVLEKTGQGEKVVQTA